MADRITVKHVEVALQRLVNVLAQRDPSAKLRSRYDNTGYFVERLFGARYRIVREVITDAGGINETHPFGEHALRAGEMYEAINFAIQVLYTERETIDQRLKATADKVLDSVAEDLDGISLAVDADGRITSVTRKGRN